MMVWVIAPTLRNSKWGPFLDYWRELLARYPEIPALQKQVQEGEARLAELSPSETEVRLSADIQLSGRLAELGQDLVSQGRVGALINAKPTDRRALLEECEAIARLADAFRRKAHRGKDRALRLIRRADFVAKHVAVARLDPCQPGHPVDQRRIVQARPLRVRLGTCLRRCTDRAGTSIDRPATSGDASRFGWPLGELLSNTGRHASPGKTNP